MDENGKHADFSEHNIKYLIAKGITIPNGLPETAIAVIEWRLPIFREADSVPMMQNAWLRIFDLSQNETSVADFKTKCFLGVFAHDA